MLLLLQGLLLCVHQLLMLLLYIELWLLVKPCLLLLQMVAAAVA
jgi:hypothetical protein